MQPFPTLGKLLIAAGVILALMGLALIFMDKIPWFGRLPGDISYEGKRVHFYFPLTTCIVISLLLTFILWLIGRR
ncbi:MAG TPA: DUF2905 domain-containing protein [Syntrophales bacterium]|nr:DUF2905 domain-containing protein [Syntrophales bacterium]HOL58718.1 DUF2905 domain-containing protein [Syntrophales bacterium]HPO34994.1 DUF2905 domain-containing protein [Syntrophales bacterium]